MCRYVHNMVVIASATCCHLQHLVAVASIMFLLCTAPGYGSLHNLLIFPAYVCNHFHNVLLVVANGWPYFHNVMLFTTVGGGGHFTICLYLHHMVCQLHTPIPSSMSIHTLEMEELAACLGRLAWGSLSRSLAICIHAYGFGNASSRLELPPMVPHPQCNMGLLQFFQLYCNPFSYFYF